MTEKTDNTENSGAADPANIADNAEHAQDGLTPLARAQARLAEMREQGWKPVHLDPIQAAKKKPNSLKLAIRSHCYSCVGRDADPGFKARVRDCTCLECALWPHRPWQNVGAAGEHDADDEVLDAVAVAD